MYEWTEMPLTSWRLVGAPTNAFWPAERRAQYLLREDSAPISADVRVSPESTPGAPDTIEMKQLVLADTPTTNANANSLDDSWALLGYDICDRSMLSGLSNCGYFAGERDQYVVRWKDRLNRWHLFDRVDDAIVFRSETDSRVPEHSPFWVVALLAPNGAIPSFVPASHPKFLLTP